MAFVITAIAAIEVAAVLHLRLVQTLVQEAMWAGALLWFALVGVGWVQRLKKEDVPLWCILPLNAVAVGSAAGIYMPAFTAFALWANAVLGVIAFLVLVRTLPAEWRACAVAS